MNYITSISDAEIAEYHRKHKHSKSRLKIVTGGKKFIGKKGNGGSKGAKRPFQLNNMLKGKTK